MTHICHKGGVLTLWLRHWKSVTFEQVKLSLVSFVRTPPPHTYQIVLTPTSMSYVLLLMHEH